MRQLAEKVQRVASKLRNMESFLTLFLTNIFKNLHFLEMSSFSVLLEPLQKQSIVGFIMKFPHPEKNIHPYINFSNIFIHSDVFLTFIFSTTF